MTTTRESQQPSAEGFRNGDTGSGSGRNETRRSRSRDHNTKARAKLIRGMRADGATYQDIRSALSLTAKDVEAVLGEVTALHHQGHSHGDIGSQVGLPRTTVRRLLNDKRERRVTARANTAAALVVDMYGIQLDVLAELLGMDLSHTRTLARQLREDGLMLPQLIAVQPGEKWLVPTKETAAGYLGWMPRNQWRPPVKDAEHYRALTMARALLVGTDMTAWVSERHLRHEAELAAREAGPRSRSREPVHIHDGRFLGVIDGTYGWWALEVELTAKSKANMDKALQGAIRTARNAEPDPMIGLLYLCRGRDVHRNVDAALGRLPRELRDVLLVATGDLDEEWHKYRSNRRRIKAANRAPNPNHQHGRRRARTTSEEEQ
ncbi:hypothetical protein [Nocardia rhamnosiphila]|uniref:Protein involved in plasmid replication-relaxation n=1 Tax=Nocardia rhamnosiphila TaxID=426716 RepID=A0ABV2WZX4_9NOCA